MYWGVLPRWFCIVPFDLCLTLPAQFATLRPQAPSAVNQIPSTMSPVCHRAALPSTICISPQGILIVGRSAAARRPRLESGYGTLLGNGTLEALSIAQPPPPPPQDIRSLSSCCGRRGEPSRVGSGASRTHSDTASPRLRHVSGQSDQLRYVASAWSPASKAR